MNSKAPPGAAPASPHENAVFEHGPKRFPIDVTQLKAVLEIVPAAAWYTTDPACRFIGGNRYAARLLRMSADSEEGPQPFRSFRNGIEAAVESLPMQRAARGEEVDNDEVELRFGDGSSQVLLIDARPLVDASGRVTGAVCVAVDLTARKLAEHALSDSTHRLELAVETTQLGLWDFDPAAKLWTGSERFGKMLARTNDQPLTYEAWVALVHPDDRERTNTAIESALDTTHGGSYSAEYRIVASDGTARWFAATGTALFDGEGASRRAVRLFGTMLDITDRKQTQEKLECLVTQLAGESARFAAMVENIPAGIVLAEAPSGRITYSNSQVEEILRHPVLPSPNAVLYDRYIGYHADGRLVKSEEWPLARALQGERIRGEDYLYQRGDGTKSWLRISGAPIHDEAGAITGALTAFYDIDPEKRAEEHRELLMNELNHRVKNTLATVQSIAAQTMRGGGLDTGLRDTFERRLIALSSAHDVLMQENWEGAELHEIAAKAMQFFKEAGPGRFAFEGPRVRLTPKAGLALAMTFHELATNAAKYGALSNTSGRVRLNWTLTKDASFDLLQLRWAEEDGPQVTAPKRKGFGSRLIERGLAQELAGTVRIDYLPTGVICTIEAPLGTGDPKSVTRRGAAWDQTESGIGS